MPLSIGMNGIKTIRRNKTLDKIPFFIISDYLDRKQVRDFNKLGIYQFVSKTNLDDLELSLRNIFAIYVRAGRTIQSNAIDRTLEP